MELPQVDEEWRFKMKGFKMEYRPTIWNYLAFQEQRHYTMPFHKGKSSNFSVFWKAFIKFSEQFNKNEIFKDEFYYKVF